MIVVAIIGILAGLSIPAFIRARARARRNTCISNMRLIDAAMDMGALEQGWDYGYLIQSNDIPILMEYAKRAEDIECPSDGEYFVRMVGSNTSCSIVAHRLEPTSN